MNLLQGRIEIPGVIWRNASLSYPEKLLLAVLSSGTLEDGVLVTYEDVAATRRLPVALAMEVLNDLTAKGLLQSRTEGRRQWLTITDALRATIKTEKSLPQVVLTQYYVQCSCGFDARMDHVDQIRVCPNCLKPVELSEMGKRYVRERNRSP